MNFDVVDGLELSSMAASSWMRHWYVFVVVDGIERSLMAVSS